MAYAVVAHPVFQVSEVGAYERKAWVVDKSLSHAFCGEDVLLSVSVLVKAVEMSRAVHPRENLSRMSAAAESDIDVDASGLNVQSVDALLQQYRNVIFFCLFHLYVALSRAISVATHLYIAYLGSKLHKNPHFSPYCDYIFSILFHPFAGSVA